MKVDRPPEFHTVTPRMVVSDAAGAVEFLRTVFDAVGEVQAERPTEVRIGDSLVMVTSTTEREPFPAFLYVYVGDADLAYNRALNAGAMSLEAPFNTPYGDRRAMVRDPFGNVFQIAHRTDGGEMFGLSSPDQPRLASSNASAVAARSSTPRSRLSLTLCACVAGSSTPVTRIADFGNAAANSAMNGIEPPIPMSIGSVPQACRNAARAAS